MPEKKQKINMTKVREFLAAVFALALVVLMAAVGSALAGWRIPGLYHITDYLGIQSDQPATDYTQQ